MLDFTFHQHSWKMSQFSPLKNFVSVFFPPLCVINFPSSPPPTPPPPISFLALFLSLAAALSQLPPSPFRHAFHSLEPRPKRRQPPHSSGGQIYTCLRRLLSATVPQDKLHRSVLPHARTTPADLKSHV